MRVLNLRDEPARVQKELLVGGGARTVCEQIVADASSFRYQVAQRFKSTTSGHFFTKIMVSNLDMTKGATSKWYGRLTGVFQNHLRFQLGLCG